MTPEPESKNAVGKENSLGQLLDRMEHAARECRGSVQDVIDEFGDRAITPFILLIAVMLVSPLSGIPGAPTIAAIMIIILAVQALSGRRQLWLPDFLRRQQVSGPKLRKAVSWIRRPCAFLDRHSHERLSVLTQGLMRWVTLALCVIIPLGWPPLELAPMVSSIGGATVALLAYGLFTRDGVYVLLGYVMIVLTAGAILSLWS